MKFESRDVKFFNEEESYEMEEGMTELGEIWFE